MTVVAPETMPREPLVAEITELAGHLAAAECRWLLLIAEFDRRAGHEQWGCPTCAHWLSWHCGLDLRSGQERVRVARALEELCWFHHRLVHEGGWKVRLDEHGEVLAIRPNGNVLPRARPPTPTHTGAVEHANRRLGVVIERTTIIPRWYGDPLRLPDVVDGLLNARRRN